VDGSAVEAVDKAVLVGETIKCTACHNAGTASLSSVTFPSGVVVDGLGNEARCMLCHQGRASKVSVDAALEKAGVLEDLDKVVTELGFINIHYYAAGATLYGGVAMGGYQYDGKLYDAKFRHVEGYDTCSGCHNPHTTELKIDECAACHEGVASKADLKKVRMAGSLVDYDGDGNKEEGVAEELDGLRAMLLTAIQAYAATPRMYLERRSVTIRRLTCTSLAIPMPMGRLATMKPSSITLTNPGPGGWNEQPITTRSRSKILAPMPTAVNTSSNWCTTQSRISTA
jgi:hypothetical protein